jgi:hypothetical protein
MSKLTEQLEQVQPLPQSPLQSGQEEQLLQGIRQVFILVELNQLESIGSTYQDPGILAIMFGFDVI